MYILRFAGYFLVIRSLEYYDLGRIRNLNQFLMTIWKHDFSVGIQQRGSGFGSAALGIDPAARVTMLNSMNEAR